MSEAQLDELEARFQAELESRGHVWNAGTASVGAITSSLSNRVAQVFGLGGFNMTVDAACASSFVALDVACCALMAGDVNIAAASSVTSPAGSTLRHQDSRNQLSSDEALVYRHAKTCG